MQRTIIALFLLMLASACQGSAAPATLTIKTLRFGTPERCNVQLYDSAGKRLVHEQQSDSRGNLELTDLKAGAYLLRFRDTDKRAYAAEKTISLSPGTHLKLEIELTDGGGAEPAGATGDPAAAPGPGRGAGR